MSGAHSILPPSSAERHAACPLSVTLEQQFPETEPEQSALEGEAAHWALAEMLGGRDPAVGERALNGVFLTQEMIEGAGMMADDIEATLEPFGMKPTDGAIEVAVAIPRTHERCWGTPDFRAWLPTKPRPTLLLYDFKYGHRYVDVFENWQLVDYVSGCLSTTSLHDSGVDVIAKIVQPRAFHRTGPIREWRFRADAIRAQVNIRHMAAIEALGPNPRAKTGPHCQDCRARHACTALQRVGFAAMDYSGRAVALDLSPDAMGLELVLVTEAIKRLEARKSGLEEQVVATMRKGKDVPGWALEPQKGRQNWVVPAEKVIAIGRMGGFDLSKPPEALTPKQAAALGFPLEQFPDMHGTPKTALALVRDDGTTARRVFG